MQNLLPKSEDSTDVFIVALGDKVQTWAFGILAQLRRSGFKAAMDFAGRSMKAQMKQANKANAAFAVIIGEDELASNTVVLKNMHDSTQQKLTTDELAAKLHELIVK